MREGFHREAAGREHFRGVRTFAGRLAQEAERRPQPRQGPPGFDRGRERLLRQLFALARGHRHVEVARRAIAEQSLKMQLAGRGKQEVRASHHVGDGLLGIVHHHRELVGEQAVAPAQHEVADVPGHALGDMPLDAIVEGDHAQSVVRTRSAIPGPCAICRSRQVPG